MFEQPPILARITDYEFHVHNIKICVVLRLSCLSEEKSVRNLVYVVYMHSKIFQTNSLSPRSTFTLVARSFLYRSPNAQRNLNDYTPALNNLEKTPYCCFLSEFAGPLQFPIGHIIKTLMSYSLQLIRFF